MANLNAGELRAVVAEVAPAVEGARVRNVHPVSERAVVVGLRVSKENLFLLLSAEPSFARLHLVRERPPAAVPPSPFCASLRKSLRSTRLAGLRQVGDDRIVELEFTRLAAGGPGGAERAEEGAGGAEGTDLEEGSVLIQELFGRLPNLVLLDGERRIRVALEYPVRGGERLRAGMLYRAPPPAGTPRASVVPPSPPAGPVPYPVSFALEERYSAEEAESRLRRRRHELLRSLERERRRRQTALDNVEADLERAARREADRRSGELLKAAWGRLERGLAEIEVVDYYSPDLETVTIELDPTLSPRENVERYFKRFRKAERAAAFLSRRRDLLREEIDAIGTLAARARDAGDPELADLEARAAGVLQRGRRRRSRDRPRLESSGPRSFVSADGWEILVGRNAKQNDELTFRLARGNDLFLHVAGRPGAHVVVRTRRGAELPKETLLDAAQLALWFSLPHRSSRALTEGARADVDYSAVKHVRKPKGAKPGTVLLASHRTLRVEVERERLARLLGSSPIDPGCGA